MIAKKLIGLVILQFAVIVSAFCQPAMDSLKVLFHSSRITLNQKALISSEIANIFMSSNIDSAKYYSSYGLELSVKENLPSGIFKNSCILGKLALSSDSLVQAAEILEGAREYITKLQDKRDALCVLLLLGYVYDMQQEYYKAREALYTGLDIAEETRDSAFLWSYYNNLGSHHMVLSDYRKVVELIHHSITIYNTLRDDQKKFSLASSYNNMGLAYLSLDQPDSALIFFEKALSMQDVKGDQYGMFNLLNNIGELYLKKGQHDLALKYFIDSGVALDSLKGRFEGITAPLFAYHYNNLGKVYFNLGMYAPANENFNRALKFAEISDDLAIKADAFQKLSYLSEKRSDLNSALSYYKKYVEAKERLDLRKNDEKITRLSLEYQFEKDLKAKQQELEVIEIENQRRELIYIFVIVTILGISVSIFLLYLLQRNKARRKHLEQKAMRLEKEKISEELDYKNKELTTNVLYLLKKNEFILSISQKLRDVLGKVSEEEGRILKGIIGELENITNEDTWNEFEVRFKEVHTSFYNRLSTQFLDLTAQDLRLCAFLRLNMTNKEIAAITFQSLDSLKTARYRLRKKLGIDRDENLIVFLTKI